MRVNLIEPTTEQILRYCGEAPVERVFLEDVARRRQGRFAGLADGAGELTALCHLGTNLVPSGTGCGAFAGLAGKSGARMLIGETGAVSELWEASRKKLPRPRLDRPGQPVYAISEPPEPGGRACERRTSTTSTCSCPRVRQRITRSSRSTRCVATRVDFAGGRALRSRRGDHGSGPRTA